MASSPHFTLIINAGGQSRRMGQAKALLSVPSGQQPLPLLVHTFQRLSHLAHETAVIAQDPAICAVADALGLACHGDRQPGLGPLGGLYTALPLVKEWLIWVACDLPLIQPALVTHLQSLAHPPQDEAAAWDAVVPQVGGRPEPMLALYHRRALPGVEGAIQARQLRMSALLEQIRTRYAAEVELRRVDPELQSFVNVNAPEDWQRILHQLGPAA
jgi:molybdopterin-guanine dinucleotide biosynthesis protein A